MTGDYTFRTIDQCPMCGHKLTARQYLGKRLNQSQGLNPKKINGISISIYKCPNCQLVYPNPLPIRTKDDRLSTTQLQEFWGDRALVYPHFDYELTVLARLIKKPLNDLVVLDIGFGLGNSLVNLSATCKAAYGIEPYEVFFNKAIELIQDKVDTSLLQCISFEEAAYTREKFDFIFFEALQHLPDLNGSIQKTLHWLKKDGIIYLEVPSSAYLFNRLINLYYRLRGLDYVVNTNPMHGNYTYYEFSEKSFIENGKRLGYKVIHHEIFPCRPPVKGVPGDLLTYLMKKTNTGMQRSIWLQKAG